MDMKFICKRKNGYAIQKVINKKNYSFGLYDTLEEAQYYRDYFIEHDWDMTKRLEFSKRKNKNKKEPKNIYKACHGKSRAKYEISKEINHHRYHFGSYNTLEEAIAARDYFIEHDWPLDERLIFTSITNIKQIKSGWYMVYRRENGKEVNYGVFSTFERAQEEVRLLRKCNWDYDVMENIDEREDYVDLSYLKTGSAFQKKKERNDFFYAKHIGLV